MCDCLQCGLTFSNRAFVIENDGTHLIGPFEVFLFGGGHLLGFGGLLLLAGQAFLGACFQALLPERVLVRAQTGQLLHVGLYLRAKVPHQVAKEIRGSGRFGCLRRGLVRSSRCEEGKGRGIHTTTMTRTGDGRSGHRSGQGRGFEGDTLVQRRFLLWLLLNDIHV